MYMYITYMSINVFLTYADVAYICAFLKTLHLEIVLHDGIVSVSTHRGRDVGAALVLPVTSAITRD